MLVLGWREQGRGGSSSRETQGLKGLGGGVQRLGALEGGHSMMMMTMKMRTPQYKVPEENVYTAAGSR